MRVDEKPRDVIEPFYSLIYTNFIIAYDSIPEFFFSKISIFMCEDDLKCNISCYCIHNINYYSYNY